MARITLRGPNRSRCSLRITTNLAFWEGRLLVLHQMMPCNASEKGRTPSFGLCWLIAWNHKSASLYFTQSLVKIYGIQLKNFTWSIKMPLDCIHWRNRSTTIASKEPRTWPPISISSPFSGKRCINVGWQFGTHQMTVYNMLNLRRLTVFMISLQDLISNWYCMWLYA